MTSKAEHKQRMIRHAEKHHPGMDTFELTEYINSHEKVLIKCTNHGLYEMTPNNYINSNSRCKQCWIDAKIQNARDSFVQKAKIVHPYNLDTYEKVDYKHSRIKVTITCRKHGDYRMRPNNHINNHTHRRCPKCRMSKIARAVYFALKSECKQRENGPSSITIHAEVPIILTSGKRYRYDFYIPERGLYIEADGKQHFEDVPYFKTTYEQQHQNDLNKDEAVLDMHQQLLRIHYKDIALVPSFIKHFIDRIPVSTVYYSRTPYYPENKEKKLTDVKCNLI